MPKVGGWRMWNVSALFIYFSKLPLFPFPILSQVTQFSPSAHSNETLLPVLSEIMTMFIMENGKLVKLVLR